MTAAAKVESEGAESRIRAAQRSAEYVIASLDAPVPFVPDTGILAGPLRRTELPDAGERCNCAGDNLHYPMDVGNLLKLGATGISAAARANAEGLDPERRANLYKKLGKYDYDDPSLYHLVLNMGLLDLQTAHDMLCNLIKK